MSKLYATIDSDSRKTQATSRGHRNLTTHAASWDGAVRVNLETLEDGRIRYSVDLVPWRGTGESRELASGIFGEEPDLGAFMQGDVPAFLRKQAD